MISEPFNKTQSVFVDPLSAIKTYMTQNNKKKPPESGF
jgi:hypothetical protein